MRPIVQSILAVLDEQRKRAEAATKGLWRHEDFPLPGTSAARYHDVTYGPADDASERFSVLEELTEADGEFIARSHFDLPHDVKLLRAFLGFWQQYTEDPEAWETLTKRRIVEDALCEFTRAR